MTAVKACETTRYHSDFFLFTDVKEYIIEKSQLYLQKYFEKKSQVDK